MATVPITVDPDGGADYTSLDTALSTEETDLQTAGDIYDFQCSSGSGSADTSQPVVDNSAWNAGLSNPATGG